MKRIVVCALLPTVLVFCFGCGGIGFAYEQELTGKFGLIACDTRTQMSLCEILPSGSGIGIVDQTVFAVGWNDDFIIAKRHPSDGSDTNDIDRSVTEFYILTVATEKLLGPLDEAEFDKQRASLGLPEDLTFILVFEDLR